VDWGQETSLTRPQRKTRTCSIWAATAPDLGTKTNILRALVQRGALVNAVLPWNYDFGVMLFVSLFFLLSHVFANVAPTLQMRNLLNHVRQLKKRDVYE
jgi:hypothetical protein